MADLGGGAPMRIMPYPFSYTLAVYKQAGTVLWSPTKMVAGRCQVGHVTGKKHSRIQESEHDSSDHGGRPFSLSNKGEELSCRR